MRTTRTISGKKAREALKNGVNAIYEPVRATFGPEGRSALLYRTMNRGNRMTDDGVTVAECQEPKDQFVRMVAQTFREGCKRTVEKVGDGTTCTAILGGKLFNEVSGILDKNFSAIGVGGKVGVVALKRKILESAEKVKEKIKEMAKKVESLVELEKIATISVKDEKLGKLVAGMAWEVGVDGFIDVVEGYKGEIETEVIKGMRFPAKTAAKGFVNKPDKFEMIIKDSDVIVTNYALDNSIQLANILNPLLNKHPKIAILAPSFSNDVLNQLYKASFNVVSGKDGGVVVTKGNYDLFPVLIPSLRTEQLEDVSIYFGAKFIDKNKGDSLSSITELDLGFVEKMVVKDTENKEDAIATGGGGTHIKQLKQVSEQKDAVIAEQKSQVEERIEVLKSQLEETRQEQFKNLLRRRIASMASAVGVIRVGDSTQANSLYTKLKIEDAVYACKAALRGGYVKGGGLCLKEISEGLSEDNILKSTLLAPYEQIQSSIDGGIDIGEDVIDPAEAIYYAVEHSSQIVANLICVDSITAEEEDPIMGEGEFEIARMIKEFVVNDKIYKGQIKAGEVEAYRDSLGGMNEYEYELTNRD
jgi:chaperonin GroEL